MVLLGDVQPLSSLPNLEVLLLDGNAVPDVRALTYLVTQGHLGMPGNALSDLWSLRRLEWRRSAAESRTQGAIHPDSGMEE